ncbi:hypothetical protein FIBSPDRAFT_851079 [Athelia psychrophila]|uniref:PBP domain-containing protein n=1 Tax=Athelia psychrophila TaxID=1759441 RepID=A0A166SWK9_9AGAM|nr:hypothetical protein FIBSPDRAFT_851079 [Fibularhizoctonia sp. CBS 109695]
MLVVVPDFSVRVVSLVTAEVHYTGNTHNTGTKTRLRISNGGAGQAGLIKALAGAFIDWSRDHGGVDEDYVIDWVVGDTTESIKYLATGDADIAITYNAAAETRATDLKIATRKEWIFRDHFYIVGPKLEGNPAGLDDSDAVLAMLNKIVTAGDADSQDAPTRFLSRFDKSATNIRESLLFAEIGQIPWAHTYSKWYHQFPSYPLTALETASKLQEYTLTDRGTFLTLESTNRELTDNLHIYKAGKDEDPADPLLNLATVLLGARVCKADAELANNFVDWAIRPDGGQDVIKNFRKEGSDEYLYTGAPPKQ